MDETNDLEKLSKLLKGMRFAMITTADPDGTLHSRPMAAMDREFDGTLWFFTREHSEKSADIARDHHVNVSYADPDNQTYISVSGTANVVKDRKKAEELYTPAVKAYFPQGLDDPELALLKVDAHSAEYWDAPSSKTVRLVKMLKGIATGQPPKMGDHEKVDLG